MDYMIILKAVEEVVEVMSSQLEVKRKAEKPLSEEEVAKRKAYALLNRPSPPY